MKDNLKHSLIKFKSKLRIRKSMAGLGSINCYSTEEYSSYLNKAMDNYIEKEEYEECTRIKNLIKKIK